VEGRVRLAYPRARAEQAAHVHAHHHGGWVRGVHYVHQRSAAKGAIPLLFVHGCTLSLASALSNHNVEFGVQGTRYYRI